MSIKSKLPTGIYINNEYTLKVKQNSKSIQSLKDKSKMDDDQLTINGIKYGLSDISQLLAEVAAYKAAQCENENHLAFHGELSPYSNFHQSLFTINNHEYHSAEHWIQFQKVMMFGDSLTANQILNCITPYEAKCLGYQVNGLIPNSGEMTDMISAWRESKINFSKIPHCSTC